MTTLRISSIATRECLRRALRRHRTAELVTLALGVALGAVAIWAIRAEHAGDPWPLAAVAVIAAGLGSAVLGVVLLAAFTVSTGALGARVGAVDARARENAQDLRAIRAGQEAIAVTQRQMIAEIARMRAQSRDQVAGLRVQVWRLAAGLERRGKQTGERAEYWQVYTDVMQDLGGLGGREPN